MACAQDLNLPIGDSLRISLITCSPGEQVYERFGHTALRVLDKSDNTDWIFNYGTFSFNEPNFIYRFVRGEGSYFLDATPYPLFAEYYAYVGRSITEQEINLLPEERRALYIALIENLQPQNAKYRYNFLYDNCTTRAVRQIEHAAGKVEYTLPEALKGKTFRNIIHEATATTPWTQFGIDLLLGSEVDRPLSIGQYFFSPLYAEKLFSTAVRVGEDGKRQLLVASTNTREARPNERMTADEPGAFRPIHAMLLLLAGIALTSLYVWKRRKGLWYIDAPLLLLQAIVGSIIFFLFFFSAHPAVGSNWLILWLNPLPFAGLALRYIPWFKKLKPVYHPFSACLTGISLLAMPFLPQQFPLSIYPFAGALFIHSLTATLIEKKQHALTHI